MKMGGAGLQHCQRRSLFLMQNDCDSSPFDQQSLLMKDYFMGTAEIIRVCTIGTFKRVYKKLQIFLHIIYVGSTICAVGGLGAEIKPLLESSLGILGYLMSLSVTI